MTSRARLGLLLGWLAVLCAVTAYVGRALHVSTDLRGFMPPARTDAQRLLLDEIGEGPGSRLLLVALDGDAPPVLAGIARRLSAALRDDAHFLRALDGETGVEALDEALLSYRYLLTPAFDVQPLDADRLRGELAERVEDLGSPAAAWLKPWLPRDPTLELLHLAEAWAPARQPRQIDGVWFDAAGTRALLLVETRAPGFDPEAQRTALVALDAHFRQAAAGSRARLEASGPGAFSVRIHDVTRDEANRIGLVDTLGFIALLLFAYRRLGTVLLGALPLASGGLLGTAALAILFGGAHGITLAFGFTLIGVAQDYPIHLFSHLERGRTPAEIARGLWPTLSTGIVGTSIAYLAFLASGVAGLEQLAVFTVTGLASAGLVTRFLLPHLIGAPPPDPAGSAWLARLWARLTALPRPRWGLPLFATAALLGVAFAPGPFWENDLAALTPLSREAMQRDAALRAELGAPDVRYLIAIEARDAESVLAASERLAAALAPLPAQGVLAGYELPSCYLPSLATQRARQARLPDPATLHTALAAALTDSPFAADTFAPFLADVEAARHLVPLTPERLGSTPLGLRLGAMLLPRDDRWVGLGTLTGLADPAALRAALATSGVPAQLLDLKDASAALVVAYRERVLVSLALAALLLVGVIGLALRRLDRVRRILAPMAVSTLVIVATLRTGGTSLSLFHLVALILAAGLGLDYALFFEHAEHDPAAQRRTLHALLVCSVSTFLVFLLLALSTLPVLRALGTSVTLGVAFNFMLAMLYARPPAEPRHAG